MSSNFFTNKTRERVIAIEEVKSFFANSFSKKLNLTRFSAPLFFKRNSKINDALNGELPVIFTPKGFVEECEIIHSSSKWKRKKLYEYSFPFYSGLYVDMIAIRQQEILSNRHSFLVDQWDWELVIKKSDRNLEFLFDIVRKIFSCLKETEKFINSKYSFLHNKLPEQITFISSKELYDLYPNLTPEQRETKYVQEHKAIFIYQIGSHSLPDGQPHSRRAYDYDDWSLNGDLIVCDHMNNEAHELSSMGIGVDGKSLMAQKQELNKSDDELADYHRNIIDEIYPFTIGGGIGQSRVLMFLLEAKHISEIQESEWTEDIKKDLQKNQRFCL